MVGTIQGFKSTSSVVHAAGIDVFVDGRVGALATEHWPPRTVHRGRTSAVGHMSSRFAVSRETRVRALLSRLIPSVAGVAPEDEMGNFDLALDWAVGNFAVHQFLDTDCAVVQREYDRTCEKLRIHSRVSAGHAPCTACQPVS